MGSSRRKSGGNILLGGIGAVLLAGLTIGLSGCGEKDTPVISEDEQIYDYIARTTVAKELFLVDSLFLPDPYTRPGDTTTYVDSIISKKRTIDLYYSPGTVNHGSLGNVREAVAIVTDELDVSTTTSTSKDTFDIFIRRYGFFLKLGSDAQEYLGWVLWGYNSLGEFNPPTVPELRTLDESIVIPGNLAMFPRFPDSVKPHPSVNFDQDYYFIRVDQIEKIAPGTKLVLEAEPVAGNPLSYYHVFVAPDTNRMRSREMIKLGTNHFIDTILVPSPNPRTHNLVVMRTYLDDAQGNIEPLRVWTIPFRTEF